MNKEIGSDFHFDNPGRGSGISFLNCVSQQAFVFSGRTAIDTVLSQMPDAKTALLPSYCCDSMLQPFKDAGVSLGFYEVRYDNGLQINPDIPENTDIFVWCNYFGYKHQFPDLTEYKLHGGIVIEDITHSMLSNEAFHDQSDFLVASVRKWEPINCGGYCAAKHGSLKGIPTKEPSDKFIKSKKEAMSLKADYLIDGDETKKPIFLSKFKECNDWLAKNYHGLCIDSESREYIGHVDVDAQRNARRNNAKALYNGLKDCNTIYPLFAEREMDCPLFVPVIIVGKRRDKIRKTLIEKDIYCPVHWPHPDACCESNLYDMELSLICDQRYTESDMEKIIDFLKKCDREI